jgi:hypothetical protein
MVNGQGVAAEMKIGRENRSKSKGKVVPLLN